MTIPALVILSKHDGAQRLRAPSKDPESVSSAMPIRGVLPKLRGLPFPRVRDGFRRAMTADDIL